MTLCYFQTVPRVLKKWKYGVDRRENSSPEKQSLMGLMLLKHKAVETFS